MRKEPSKNVEAIRYVLRFTASGKRLITRAAAVCKVRPEEFCYRAILNLSDGIVEERSRKKRAATKR